MEAPNSIHGHEVIKMILAQEGPLDVAALEAKVTERYGTNVVFHTCSRSGMTLDELVDFLLSRGKALQSEDGIGIVRDRVCSNLD